MSPPLTATPRPAGVGGQLERVERGRADGERRLRRPQRAAVGRGHHVEQVVEAGRVHRPDAGQPRARAREGERAVVAHAAHVHRRRPARAGPALGEELLAARAGRGLQQRHRAERPGRDLGLLAVDVGQVLPRGRVGPVGAGRQPDDGRRAGQRARDVGVGALHRDVGELAAVVERRAADGGLRAVGRVGGAGEVPRAVAVGHDAAVGEHVVLDAEARAEGHGRAEGHPAVARGGHVLAVVGALAARPP